MLELKDFMPVNFLKKEKFTGSFKGLRFRMEKLEKKIQRKRFFWSASGRSLTAMILHLRKKRNSLRPPLTRMGLLKA